MLDLRVKLLIVDDEVEIGETLKEIFEPHFGEVQYCSDPRQALSVLETTEFSLIMSDLMMPELHGSELVRRVRAKGDLTPIIFLTAYADKNAALTAMRLGVSDLIEKPFPVDSLVRTVDRVLEIEKRRRELHAQKIMALMDPDSMKKAQKLLGLLHVANEKKSA